LVFRGHVLEVTVDKEGTDVQLISGDPLTINLLGEQVTLTR
ncbi:MAG: glycosyl hydrolase family 65 protein, partial [Leuconostoc mesenteroides]